MLDLGTFNGQVYGLPFSVSLPVGYYNMNALGKAGITTLPETWDEQFDGFAFDPPYGRNAWKSEDGFELLEGALASCHSLSSEDANLVTLIPWPPSSISESIDSGISFGKSWSEIASAFSESGWEIMSTSPIRVHRSLARLLIHAERK